MATRLSERERNGKRESEREESSAGWRWAGRFWENEVGTLANCRNANQMQKYTIKIGNELKTGSGCRPGEIRLPPL